MPKIKKEKLQKFLGYSLVASSALAMTTNAQAAVHYSGTQNLVVDTDNSTINVDLNNDGTTDFIFRWNGTTYTATYTYYYSSSYIITITFDKIFRTILLLPNNSGGLGGDGVINDTQNGFVERLSEGYSIKSNLNWDSSGLLAKYFSSLFFYSQTGNFLGERGYIGVRFHSDNCRGSNYHYGWIQFEAAADASSGTIIDWAYEDECNVPIKAGDKGEPQTNTNIPVPLFGGAGLAGLGALLGAAGVAGIRREERDEKD